jgi:hypothetical protein
MEICYLINGKKYLDNYLLREELKLNRSEIQKLMIAHPFPKDEIIKIQNRKLYSLSAIHLFIKTLLEANE